MDLLFEHWTHSPPAAEALAMIERLLSSFFGVNQRPSPPTPAKPAQVIDIQSLPGLQQGTPAPWMTAEEYLRRKAEREGTNGNAS